MIVEGSLSLNCCVKVISQSYPPPEAVLKAAVSYQSTSTPSSWFLIT